MAAHEEAARYRGSAVVPDGLRSGGTRGATVRALRRPCAACEPRARVRHSECARDLPAPVQLEAVVPLARHSLRERLPRACRCEPLRWEHPGAAERRAADVARAGPRFKLDGLAAAPDYGTVP